MGNITSSCFRLKGTPSSMVKLIFWGGATQLLPENHLAGELLFEYPDRVICHADSFYVGRPIPILSIEDTLLVGQTYFVLPVDFFPSSTKNLTTAMLASLSKQKTGSAAGGNSGSSFSFEYVKGYDGRMTIKVLAEFIIRIISDCNAEGNTIDEDGGSSSPICTTPELRKHYDQLVGCRERPWLPKLETIKERKPRSSPVRLLGLEKI